MDELKWNIIAVQDHFIGICISIAGLYACTIPEKKKETLKEYITKTNYEVEETSDPFLLEIGEYLWNLWLGKEETKRPNFTIDFSDYSPKQVQVYKNTMKIPRGEVRTYGELAEISGLSNAARFVGTCMKKNRLPLIVPCHRVVRKDALGQYGSDPELKRILLEREGFDVIKRFNRKRKKHLNIPL